MSIKAAVSTVSIVLCFFFSLAPALQCGAATQITFGACSDNSPQWSPDGTTIAFVSDRSNARTLTYDIWAVSPDGTNLQQLARSIVTSNPSWRDAGLVQPKWLADTGDLLILDAQYYSEVMRFRLSEANSLPITRSVWDGDSELFTRLLFVPGGKAGAAAIANADGTAIAWLASLDHARSAFEIRLYEGPLNTYIGDTNTAGRRLLRTDTGGGGESDACLAFSPDGHQLCAAIAMSGRPAGQGSDLYMINLVTGTIQRLTATGDQGIDIPHITWSSTGWIAFAAGPITVPGAEVTHDLYKIRPDGTGLTQLTDTVWDEVDPCWSPDGTRLAFASNEAGNYNIYIMEMNIDSWGIPHTVTVSADPAAGGTATGGGTYDDGATVTVVATPNAGYDFVNWTEDDTAVSTSASYTFTATADRSLVARFLPTSDTTSPALVQDFSASDGEEYQSTLCWTNPSDSDLACVLVRRRAERYPLNHEDGVAAYVLHSPVPSGRIKHQDVQLDGDVTYYYAVFSLDSSGNWNDQVIVGETADTARTGPETPAWRRDLQVGDLLFAPTSLGGLGHIGIYVGHGQTVDPQLYECVHAIESWDSREEVYILRVNCPADVRQAAADQAWLIGQYTYYRYDWRWVQKNADPTNTWWYCSELVWAVYKNQGVDLSWISPGTEPPIPPFRICMGSNVTRIGGHCEGVPGCCGGDCGCGKYLTKNLLLMQAGLVMFGSNWPTIAAFVLFCPVDMAVTDPDGLTVSKGVCTVEDGVYFEGAESDAGPKIDAIFLPTLKLGMYRVVVTPEPGAASSSTYTLSTFDPRTNKSTLLADDVPIPGTAGQAYTLWITEQGVQTTCPGDVTGDGVVDLLDVRLCMQVASGDIAVTPAQRSAADIDHNGDVDLADAQILAAYVLGLRSSLP